MSTTEAYIGVDVAKKWIDTFDPTTGKSRRIKTERRALSAFAASCERRIVILEATGGYERPVMAALSEAGIAYNRVNPRHAREFARASGRLAKTDKVDAQILARTGTALGLQPDRQLDHATDRFAMLTARREVLVEQRKQEKVRLQQCVDSYILKDIKSLITLLSKRIDKLESEIAAHISAHKHLNNRHELLLSAPGVGNVVAAILLAKLPELGTVNRQAIANLAGLAPHACDSGHMRGRRKIWGGRAEVRSALYIAGFIASKSYPEFRSYRKKLEDAGKPFKIAVIAVARRLLVQLNAMIRENRIYKRERTHSAVSP